MIAKRTFLVGALIFFALAVHGFPSSALARPKPDRVALQGYDPVAYFDGGTPQKGSPEFSEKAGNITYWFASAASRDSFKSDPARYAPRYDGYCAMTLSGGVRLEANPKIFTVIDGKLYVFRFKRDIKLFAKKGPALIRKADLNWEKLKNQQ